MRKGIFIIILNISIISQIIIPGFSAPQPLKEWTYMVYIAGDNDLDEDNGVVVDIEEEYSPVGSNNNLNIMVLADRAKKSSGWTSTKLFYVTKGMKANSSSAIADWGERNMGSSDTLYEFVKYCKENYPAKKYALVMWNHAGGWYKGTAMFDETNNDTLDVDETDEALKKCAPLDTIIIDACQGQTIETQRMWIKYAKAISASQDRQYWDGVIDLYALQKLVVNPQMDAVELANHISKTRHESTSSTVELGKDWYKLQDSLNTLAISLINNYDKYKNQYDVVQHFGIGTKVKLKFRLNHSKLQIKIPLSL
jgi:hypothetical protein